jgi:hypothetical protein
LRISDQGEYAVRRDLLGMAQVVQPETILANIQVK